MKYARQGADVQVVAKNVRYLIETKRKRNTKLPWVFLKSILFDWNDSREEMESFLSFGEDLGVDRAGWDLNASDPTHSSKRVALGTTAYDELVARKLILRDLEHSFPVWP